MKKILGRLLILAGAGILLWSFGQREIRDRRIFEAIQDYKKECLAVQQDGDPVQPELSTDVLYLKAKRYNASLVNNQDFEDAAAFEALPEGWEDYEERSFALIRIDAIDCELPIYLGASEAHMASGAALLTGTSLPIGGIGTHAVIVGHRGYYGSDLFKDLDRLCPGDIVSIQNYWGELSYKVVRISVIDPDDLEELYISEEKDRLSLVTCDPCYAVDGRYRRLVITCERVF